MAYEPIKNIRIVKLGGVNDKTGKKNPTQLEGFYRGWEMRPNKYKPEQPQKLYIFDTKDGLDGIYGTGGLNYAIKNAKLHYLTRVTATGREIPSTKGLLPTKEYLAEQDKTQIDTDSSYVAGSSVDEDEPSAVADYESDEETSLDSEETTLDEISYRPAVKAVSAPKASVATVAQQASVQDRLRSRLAK